MCTAAGAETYIVVLSQSNLWEIHPRACINKTSQQISKNEKKEKIKF
jgi:hypothetical protein